MLSDGGSNLPWRVETSDGQRGTVRFTGTLGPSPHAWHGVEWDDASRGRHSGSHNGIEYFNVRTPGSASFVRADAVKLRHPRSLLRALAVKYLGASDDDDNDDDPEVGGGDGARGVDGELSADGAVVDDLMLEIGGKVASSHGWAKITKMQREVGALRVVGFAGMRIGCNSGGGRTGVAQNPDVIRPWVNSVVDLDLSRNLFVSVEEVAEICTIMTKLEILRLNYNRFVSGVILAGPPSDGLLNAFRAVKVLAVIGTLLTWEQVERVIAPSFPVLEELHFGFNEIDSVESRREKSEPAFPRLSVLNLESNKLASWPQITKTVASSTPNVTTLFLNDNAIAEISSDTTRILPNITTLNISSNSISTWIDLHNLTLWLPQLTHLRLKGNPIVERVISTTAGQGQAGRRLDIHMELIARLRGITSLNGSDLPTRLRRDSELWYLSRCHTTVPADSTFAATHPRYDELVAIHGPPDLPSASDVARGPAGSIKDRMIELDFFADRSEDKVVRKRVPVSITVRALRSLVARLLRSELGDADGPSLVLRAVIGDGQSKREVPMDDELREMGYYDVKSGDRIRVSCS